MYLSKQYKDITEKSQNRESAIDSYLPIQLLWILKYFLLVFPYVKIFHYNYGYHQSSALLFKLWQISPSHRCPSQHRPEPAQNQVQGMVALTSKLKARCLGEHLHLLGETSDHPDQEEPNGDPSELPLEKKRGIQFGRRRYRANAREGI